MGRSTTATLNFAVEMLKCGLSINGAGAKTAAGYGWFDPASDERIADRSSCSQEELEAVYQVEVSGLPSIGLEEIVDSLDARDEHFQRLYLIRLMNEKASLLRKWGTHALKQFRRLPKNSIWSLFTDERPLRL